MRSPRLPVAVLGAAVASLLTVGSSLAGVPLPPEKQIGSIGPVLIRDSFQTTAATCDYADSGVIKLQRIVVKAPDVRWPDTSSENDNQHGTVRHRILVEKSTDGGASWTAYRSSVAQSMVAYENAPATLTKRIVSVDLASSEIRLRVSSKIQWLRPNGTVRGSLRHWYSHAHWGGDQLQGSIESGVCNNKIID